MPADTFLPDPQVARSFGVTLMTLWRWSNDPKLDFPKRIKIGRRNYRSQAQLDEWRERMVRKSLRNSHDVQHKRPADARTKNRPGSDAEAVGEIGAQTLDFDKDR